MSTTPNYSALLKLLPLLKNLVDACGEVRLDDDEAAQIRLLGFAAESGRWKVPPIPPELVRDNPLLEHLSTGCDVRETSVPSVPMRHDKREREAEIGQALEPLVRRQAPSRANAGTCQNRIEATEPVSVTCPAGQDHGADRELIEEAA